MIFNSFTNAIFMSLCAFSMDFAASATLIELVIYVPALIIDLYNLSIVKAVLFVEPDVNFVILLILYFSSPGLILSGEYPQKNLY